MCRKFIKKHRISAPTSVSGIHPDTRVNSADFCTQCHKGVEIYKNVKNYRNR